MTSARPRNSCPCPHRICSMRIQRQDRDIRLRGHSIRKNYDGNGRFPAGLSEYAWTAQIPFEELPVITDPDEGLHRHGQSGGHRP